MDTAWESAVRDNDVWTAAELLERGANVNARDRYGQTALMLGAHAGHREIVEMLIACRADLNVAAKHGLGALMLAVVAGHYEIARLLAKAGADLSLRGSGAPGFSGKTASDLAAERGLAELAAELVPDRNRSGAR